MRGQKLKRKDFQKVLEESPYIIKKSIENCRRRAKCSSTKCEKDLKSGFLCLCLSGELSVLYQAEKTVLRKFYFCPVKTYIHERPPWTNIKFPEHITRDEIVSEAELNRIRQKLEI